MSEELKNHFCLIGDSLNAALAHYQIWATLRGQKAIDEYYDDMDDYRHVDFFLAINSGNYKLMFLETANLFDSDERTASFRKLKDCLCKNSFNNEALKIDAELNKFSGLVKNIKVIRSKLIAHKEVDVAPKDLYKKHKIKPDEIRDLLNTCAKLLSELESNVTGELTFSTICTTDRYESATNNLLQTIKNGRNS
jgi:hypothetical protein